MKLKRFFVSVMLTLIMAAAPLFAAGQSGGASGPVSGVEGLGSDYPLKTDVTVTWWHSLDANTMTNYSNHGDTPWGKELIAKTGIKVEFQHPPASSVAEQFNLMVADGNFPDILEYNWLGYPGGPEKAIEDGVIIRLNDIFEKYCPNITAYLKARPDIDRMIKTDSGSYYAFPFIRDDDKLLLKGGHMVRKDWLDDLGMAVPETIDEWYMMLKAFKEKKNSPAPLSFEYSGYLNNLLFPYAYNTDRNFYVGNNGKIHYGAIENGYRDWLTTFAVWYKEGLVDPDIVTQQFAQISAKVTGNQTGATIGSLGSRMGTWTNSARTTNPRFHLVAAPIPVLRKGEKPVFRVNVDNPYPGAGSAAISSSCQNVEVAARLLDWGYSEAGSLLNNFGIEGESYTIVNGVPRYTDQAMNNPKGWSLGQSLAAYVRAIDNGPFIQDVRYFEQYMVLPEQQAALTIWAGGDGLKFKVPPITPTPDESREYARIMNEITTYTNEMIIKFTLGTESLSGWDTYVNTVKRMGIDQAIAIQEAALARYNDRK